MILNPVILLHLYQQNNVIIARKMPSITIDYLSPHYYSDFAQSMGLNK
ncbi:hypothetical protein PCIT_a1491 [Pseudoalteromonas citrea]|uniref:Uncharacterized protein n=1 Tax=Pseudoalteromonas citrea TaxID=43655 RepID=A0AAD4AMG0_9GAMM|nr:hypothetical protein PCIT_a1491 [Pseudoalteromonas citrea]